MQFFLSGLLRNLSKFNDFYKKDFKILTEDKSRKLEIEKNHDFQKLMPIL